MTKDWLIMWTDDHKHINVKEFDDPFTARDWKVANCPSGHMYHLITW
jgi:hypothetical protein